MKKRSTNDTDIKEMFLRPGDERALLFYAMHDINTFYDLSSKISANDFLRYEHALLFAVLASLQDRSVIEFDLPSTGSPDPMTSSSWFTDFFEAPSATATGGEPIRTWNGGTGAAIGVADAASASRPGIVRYTTGSTNTGRASLLGGLGSLFYEVGATYSFETTLRMTQLLDVTETGHVAFGFLSTGNSTTQADGAYFLYDPLAVHVSATSSGFWQVISSNTTLAGGKEATVTDKLVAANEWVTLKVVITDVAGTPTIRYYINNILKDTDTVKIPDGPFTFGMYLWKTAGTTPVTMDVDYMKLDLTFPSRELSDL
jgi:hypothetical protein